MILWVWEKEIGDFEIYNFPNLYQEKFVILKDFKDIAEKAKKQKNIKGDIEDYNDYTSKFEKRYRKLEDLYRKL